MSSWRKARRVLGRCLESVVIIVLAPAVVVAGELVNRRHRRELRVRQARLRPGRRGRVVVRAAGPGWATYEGGVPGPLAWAFLRNPVWIALTAPARWLLDRVRPRAGGRRGQGGGNGPPGAGVREPRRPRPDLPAGAIALPEPPPGPEGSRGH